jgi:hypothetical protein
VIIGDFTFAHGGDEALVALDEQNYDAVVANLTLPGMSGAELLQEVRHRRPDIWRFLRAQPEAVAMPRLGRGRAPGDRSAGWGRRYPDPPQPGIHPSGLETQSLWLKLLLSTCPLLPSPPKLYYQNGRTALLADRVARKNRRLIEQDAPMAARILQMVNSAFFALQLKVNRASDAVLYLGVETTKAVVLMAHTVSSFQSLKRIALPAEKIFSHSFHTARYARWIAQQECPRGQTSDQAFTAGLLHDIGKFLLAANRGEAYARAIEYACKGQMTLQQAETDFFGVDHAELGGCLLASWGIPHRSSMPSRCITNRRG